MIWIRTDLRRSTLTNPNLNLVHETQPFKGNSDNYLHKINVLWRKAAIAVIIIYPTLQCTVTAISKSVDRSVIITIIKDQSRRLNADFWCWINCQLGLALPPNCTRLYLGETSTRAFERIDITVRNKLLSLTTDFVPLSNDNTCTY